MILELQAKPPGNTAFLRVGYNEVQPTDRTVMEAICPILKELGWEQDPWTAPALPNGDVYTFFLKRGSGLFGGWTSTEKSANLRALRQAFKRLGISLGRVRVLKFHEML